MIENYYNTDFNLTTRTESKVDGRRKTIYTLDPTTYKCAIFTPSTARTVRFGGEDYIIQKNLYCDISVPLEHGDYVTVDGGDFTIGNINNTNNIGHHLAISLISRVK